MRHSEKKDIGEPARLSDHVTSRLFPLFTNNNNNNNNFNSNILVRFFRNYLQTISNL